MMSSAHLPVPLGLHGPLVTVLAELGIGAAINIRRLVQLTDGAAAHGRFQAFHPGNIERARKDGRVPLGPLLCALVTALADSPGGLVLPPPTLLGQLLDIEGPGAPAP